MTTTSPELLTYAQAAQRVNLGVLDVRPPGPHRAVPGRAGLPRPPPYTPQLG